MFLPLPRKLGGTQEITEADLTENQKDVSVPIEFSVGAAFNVRLPSAIELTKGDSGWGYTGAVGVKGDITSGSEVMVTPNSSITMYDVTNRPTDDVPANADDQSYSHKDAKSVAVAQTKNSWKQTEINADTYTDTDLNLTAGAMKSGNWKGTLNVNISYCEYEKPGLYATDGTYTSWNELVSSGKITITDNVIQKCDTSVSGKLVVPEGITGIKNTSGYDKEAFYDCTNLTEVVLPSTMTSIGSSAFCGCSKLTSVTIPDSVTSIGDHAFYDCASLETLTIPEGVTTIGQYTFYECTSLTNIDIPSSVSNIVACAFYMCSNLDNVTIPEGVKQIDSMVFSGTGLTNIIIPDSVTFINTYAFCGCSKLTSVTIPDSVTSIADDAFSSCSNLTSVTIPDSVTNIGDTVFSNCNKLTSIIFNGTKEQWNTITKGENWKKYSKITTIHCTDGDITL